MKVGEMKYATLWLLSILAVVFLSICILFSGGIYTVVIAPSYEESPGAFKVNRFTGNAEYMFDNKSFPVLKGDS